MAYLKTAARSGLVANPVAVQAQPYDAHAFPSQAVNLARRPFGCAACLSADAGTTATATGLLLVLAGVGLLYGIVRYAPRARGR